MQNVKTEIKGNNLIITVDLSARLGPSSTGKTLMVATTKGNANTGKDGIKFGLNVFAPLS
jgi:hypothetical protein